MDDLSIKQILTLLQSEYPNSFVNQDARTMKLKEKLWIKEFENTDINLVYAAVRLYMKSPERFAPSIGQIREKIQALTGEEELSEQEAWSMVSKACQNGLYGYKEEFEKLPKDVQSAVGAPEQLRAWASMDSETVQSVVSSNFMRTYRTQSKRRKELSLLPENVREMLSGGVRMLE
jgi:hypothetical protein